MKLAVKKDISGTNPLGGFHYMLHPMAMKDEREAAIFDLIGYTIIEVGDAQGAQLLDQARAALNHQVQVAYLTEAALSKPNPVGST